MVSSMTLGAPKAQRSTVTRKKLLTVDSSAVARVAYELFKHRGGLHGYDVQDWLEAERIVRQQEQ